MRPEHYKGFKLFEPNLTLARNLSCAALGWPVYDSTVTHGVPPVTMTLDLYDRKEPAPAAGPCCEECVAPKMKYYSVDTPHGHCGESCMRPEHYRGFKLFEPNLTLAGNLSCAALGWPVYDSTVTHGVPPITMTLDLYDRKPVLYDRKSGVSIEQFRTDTVQTGFDISKTEGLWYEIAFRDVAQAGSSCQTFTNVVQSSTGEMSQTVSVRYSTLPYTQTIKYEPTSTKKGVFKKHLEGAGFFELPTVVVDVANGKDGKYSLMTEYSVVDVGVSVKELRFMARTPTLDSAMLKKMKDVAVSVGIDRSFVDSVQLANHANCSEVVGVGASAPLDLHNTMILQPPARKTGDAAVWIVLPGAEIDKTAYRPLAEAVQAEASMPLWVAVLGTYFAPTAVPPEIGPRIDQVLKDMEQQGLDLQSVKLFYGGHSLGSVFIQDHLKAHHGDGGPMQGQVKVLGQVLMGGFIQRKYAGSYPVTTLTIGGELDGLARITRLAEAFYRAKGSADFPVAVVPGLTHMQFASGEPPLLVRMRDLQPEITESEAHGAIAKLVAPYFEQLCGITGAAETLSERLASTAELVKPIIGAYELEGSRYFNAPAQIGGPEQGKCIKGGCPGSSTWATVAQGVISGVDDWSLNITNEYVDCSSTPLTGEEFHLPKITNNTETHTISITTYSQAFWDDAEPSWFHWKEIFDSFDTGFVATSAEEIGTKLASRQCTLILGAGKADTPFSVDDPQFCALANQKAYEWAKDHAGATTAARFEKHGQKFTFADDLAKSGGPLFLDAHLQFNEKIDASGEKVIEVAAPMQKTEIDYWTRKFGPIPRPSFIPDPGCFHYCKLLSPARAMEWIYTDALRVKRGLGAPTSTTAVFI